jgi:hypothetical protein
MLLVEAYIHPEGDINTYIVDGEGNLPKIDRAELKMNTIDAIRHLGQLTVGQALIPLRVLSQGPQSIWYEMVAIPDGTPAIEPYQWKTIQPDEQPLEQETII